MRSGPAGEEVRFEEGREVEVDGEVDSKKKFDQRKKELVKQMRTMSLLMCRGRVVDQRHEKWRQELQEINQRRNDLLPEHQKMQKMSQRFQDKKKLCKKKTNQLAEENAQRMMVKNPGGLLGRSGAGSGRVVKLTTHSLNLSFIAQHLLDHILLGKNGLGYFFTHPRVYLPIAHNLISFFKRFAAVHRLLLESLWHLVSPDLFSVPSPTHHFEDSWFAQS